MPSFVHPSTLVFAFLQRCPRTATPSVTVLEPGGDPRPDMSVGLAADENSKVLQTNSALARILDDLGRALRHCFREGLHRSHWGHLVGEIHHRERGRREGRRSDVFAADAKLPAIEAVLAIKPLDELANELA